MDSQNTCTFVKPEYRTKRLIRALKVVGHLKIYNFNNSKMHANTSSGEKGIYELKLVKNYWSNAACRHNYLVSYFTNIALSPKAARLLISSRSKHH